MARKTLLLIFKNSKLADVAHLAMVSLHTMHPMLPRRAFAEASYCAPIGGGAFR